MRQIIAGHTSITLEVVGILDAGGADPIPSIRSVVQPFRPCVRNQVTQSSNAASTLQRGLKSVVIELPDRLIEEGLWHVRKGGTWTDRTGARGLCSVRHRAIIYIPAPRTN